MCLLSCFTLFIAWGIIKFYVCFSSKYSCKKCVKKPSSRASSRVFLYLRSTLLQWLSNFLSIWHQNNEQSVFTELREFQRLQTKSKPLLKSLVWNCIDFEIKSSAWLLMGEDRRRKLNFSGRNQLPPSKHLQSYLCRNEKKPIVLPTSVGFYYCHTFLKWIFGFVLRRLQETVTHG